MARSHYRAATTTPGSDSLYSYTTTLNKYALLPISLLARIAKPVSYIYLIVTKVS
jgi:hypothetical protein